MRKSISVAFFSTVSTLMVLGIVLMGGSEWLLFSNYFAKDRYATLDEVVNVTRRTAQYLVQEAALPEGEELDTLSTKLEIIGESAEAYLFFTDNEGNVLIASNPDKLSGCAVPEAVLQKTDAAPENYHLFSTMDGVLTEKSYISASELRSERGGHSGYVFLCSSGEQLTEFKQQFWSNFLLSSCVMLLCASVLTKVLMHKLTDPLQKVTDAAQRFGGGDLSVRVEGVEGEGEVADLARTFNTMAENIQMNDNSRGQFMGNIAHELRTPMTTIKGFIDGILDGTIPPEMQNHYLQLVSEETGRLARLIQNMLDLSKLEADQMKIEPIPTDFRELGEEVMKVFQYRAGEQQIELRIDMPPLPEMELDKLRIRQVLFNLIGNAVKFTNEGSVTLKAECQPNGDGTCEFTFMVIDTGPGIAPEDQAKLMKPFVQLSRIRGTDANNNGTGLGLTISKRLIEKMKGSLWLKSEPGKGSVFGASLHRIRISNDATISENSQTAEFSCTAEAATLSILIVDDVALNLKVMKALCRKAGIENIETALSGKEALTMLEKQSFDLVLTDMWMPEMTGAVLAEKIRSDKRFRNIPILAVTADVEAKDNFPLENFNGVLLKPVTIEKVHKMMDFARNSGGLYATI